MPLTISAFFPASLCPFIAGTQRLLSLGSAEWCGGRLFQHFTGCRNSASNSSLVYQCERRCFIKGHAKTKFPQHLRNFCRSCLSLDFPLPLPNSRSESTHLSPRPWASTASPHGERLIRRYHTSCLLFPPAPPSATSTVFTFSSFLPSDKQHLFQGPFSSPAGPVSAKATAASRHGVESHRGAAL